MEDEDNAADGDAGEEAAATLAGEQVEAEATAEEPDEIDDIDDDGSSITGLHIRRNIKRALGVGAEAESEKAESEQAESEQAVDEDDEVADEEDLEQLLRLAKERTERAMKRAGLEKKKWQASYHKEREDLRRSIAGSPKAGPSTTAKASASPFYSPAGVAVQHSMQLIKRVTLNAVNPLAWGNVDDSDEEDR